MSIEAMAWALETAAPSTASKLLLILLSDSADMDGNVAVYPEFIGPLAMMDGATLDAELNRLEVTGLIERDPNLRLPLDDVIAPGVEVIRLRYPREAGL
jgi:hypothetical protein